MKKMFLIGFFLILGILFIVYLSIYQDQRANIHFETFCSAEIDSQIESVRIAYKGTGMKLSDGREFVFYPYTDQNLNEGNIFNYTAEKEDKVVKKAYSDTLYLIKNDKKLAYTFKKF